ncbi:hypothetical protein L1049_018081 [Liquidambar formosana]|uniref:Uncharacterized protein n=1 Tax=Liquidambar formosana TaxID=63359 RepID=A0AAP0NNF0_LIQFO
MGLQQGFSFKGGERIKVSRPKPAHCHPYFGYGTPIFPGAPRAAHGSGYGACGFFQWQDTQGKTTINGYEAESKHFSSPPSTRKQRANSDLGEDGDFSVKRLKKMECESPVIDSAQHSLNFVDCGELCEQSNISSPKHYNALPYGSLEIDSSFPDSTTGQLVISQTKSWGSMIEKTPKASLLTSLAGIHQWQTEFLWQISAVEVTSSRYPTYQILGLHVQGWLGRLAFPPPRCLTVPPPKPFFCCVFPSFDFILVPKDVDVPHSPLSVESDKSGRLSLVNSLPNAQLSSGVLWEPLGLKSPPNVVQGNILTESTLKALGQAAAYIQSNLLALLESMDPLDHESMVREANSTFVALDGMSVDYRPFYERIREFIGCVYWLAQIEWSIHNDISSKELINRYNSTKLRFDDLSRSHVEAVAVFAASDERLQLLREEASRVKNLLLQIEDQLSSCEAETKDLKTHRDEISEEMLEWEQSFLAASREAAEALKLHQQREVELKEAKAALEKARVQLRQ